MSIEKISINQILTSSTYDEENDSYKQQLVKLPIEGNIETENLNNIIRVNEFLLTGLLDIDVDKSGKGEIDVLKEIFLTLFAKITPNDKFLEKIKMSDLFSFIMPFIWDYINEENLQKVFNVYKKYNEEHVTELKLKYQQIKKNGTKSELVSHLIGINRTILPDFSIGLLLCIISELYVIFMDITNEIMGKDALVIHVLFSYLQNTIYSSDGYNIQLKEFCIENKIAA